MNNGFQLDDGSYDVLVVDASVDGDAIAIAIELTIVAGAHKGDVVAVRATGLGVDELELLGLPGTLHVENGVPRFASARENGACARRSRSCSTWSCPLRASSCGMSTTTSPTSSRS